MPYLHGIETIITGNGIRPVQTLRTSVIGVIGTAPDADAGKFPLDSPVLLANEPGKIADLGATGTLPSALRGIYDQGGAVVVVVRVAEGEDEDATLLNVAGDKVTSTGIHAFSVAQSVIDATPKILCAPGWTHQRTGGANSVVAALKTIIEPMGAIVVQDAPGNNSVAAQTVAEDSASDRIYVVDPMVRVATSAGIVTEYASGRVAGVIARVDNERGFWHSPSNQPVLGIIGTGRPIGFHPSDPNSEANLLNENNVAAIVALNGYRLWGNKSSGGDDPLYQFLAVRRTVDTIVESVQAAHLWAMDRPMSAQLLEDILGSVNAYLRDLVARGALLGGKAWLDPELNSKTALAAGQLYVNYDLEPAAPLDRLTFMVQRETDYYEALISSVAQAA